MEEINRLHDIADDIDRTSWGYQLADALHRIAADIGEKVDEMRHVGEYEDDVLTWVEAYGGLEEVKKELSRFIDRSGYESDVLAWVEKNGGLDAVKEQRRESIPRAAYERKKAGWLDHIEECEEALARRNGRIAELRRERDKLRDEASWAESLSEILDEWADLLGFPEQKGDPGKITARVGAVLDGTWRRLMPEGMEWPRFEDGEPVRLGDHWQQDGYDVSITRIDSIEFAEDGVRFENEYADTFYRYGERVKRPAPKVLDADGVETNEGDMVRVVGEAWPSMKVLEIRPDDDPDEPEHLVWCGEMCGEPLSGTKKWRIATDLTHRAPVLADDGKPLREGETVWDTSGRRQFRVLGFGNDVKLGEYTVKTVGIDGMALEGWSKPSDLTHERPDSWERLEDDATLPVVAYCDRMGIEVEEGSSFVEPFARDLVRRAKAIAKRGR